MYEIRLEEVYIMRDEVYIMSGEVWNKICESN